MGSPYLTKSDFKSCFDCATKLYYRKHAYPSNQDENEYLRFLAEGGFMIETVAKAKYPSQNDLVSERDPVRAFERTKEIQRLADAKIQREREEREREAREEAERREQREKRV